MANNFKVSFRKERDTLHIRVKGDFDGMSAYQLLRVLKTHAGMVKRILINTGSLKSVQLFGKRVFHGNLGFLNRQPCDLRFTGQKAAEFTSYGLMEG
jgi:hypothetical protein